MSKLNERLGYLAMSAIVDELKAVYPEAGFSFGYIGNVGRWGDDRGWYVFTGVNYKDGSGPIKYGPFGTDSLDAMAMNFLRNTIM